MKVKLYLAIFGASLLIFSATSADRMLTQSRAPHFVYLADSLLHGQLDNRVPPPNNNDWVVFEDKTYVIFHPFPAVLMLPLAALFGIGFNDVIFTVIAAALNVLLMFLVLQLLVREGLSRMSPEENLWLCALFGFGTIHYSCAVIGEVRFSFCARYYPIFGNVARSWGNRV